MYSGRVGKALKVRKIDVGDSVLVINGKKEHSGILMPRTDASHHDIIIIKLDSGYNVGIRYDSKTRIKRMPSRRGRGKAAPKKDMVAKTIEKYDLNKPPISLISVGGTISSKVDYKTGGVIALSKPEEILQNVPELKYIANVRDMKVPFNKMSEDMNHLDWQKLARLAAKHLNDGDKGVIITHGTDFLHYTSAALSFFLEGLTKPVVLVGSQRSSDRGSSDAGMNLVCAAHVAVGDIAEVGICMHSSINDISCMFSRGTKVRKMDTQRRDAFRPINEYPLALVWPDGKMKVKNHNHRTRDDAGKVKVNAKFDPNVAMVKVYPGASPEIIDHLVSKGTMGIVIETSGLGHVPTNGELSWIDTIKKYSDEGITFACTAQTIYGRVNQDVYTNLRKLYTHTGAIPCQDMISETAYVKLGWVLGHFMNQKSAPDANKVREMMLTNYAGEMSKRTMVGSFLY